MYHAMRINVLKPLSSTIFPNIFYLKPSARTLLIQSFGIISNTVSITTSEHYLKRYQKRPNFMQYQNCMISGLFLLSKTVLILSVVRFNIQRTHTTRHVTVPNVLIPFSDPFLYHARSRLCCRQDDTTAIRSPDRASTSCRPAAAIHRQDRRSLASLSQSSSA